jgi:mannitol/fructose-specific phosphotransferase system IIA component (Ntr-type)
MNNFVVFTLEELTTFNEKQLVTLAEYLKISVEGGTKEELIAKIYEELNKQYAVPEEERHETIQVRRIRESMEGA